MREIPYDRQAAIAYAQYWAYRRNPAYFSFNDLGGDCTNFASQSLYEGCGVMNYTPTFGWYYINVNSRSPSWSGVEYFYNFLTTNKGVGPYATQVMINQMEPGDLIQLRFRTATTAAFQHTPVIIRIEQPITPDTIWVAAHSNDADCRPLSTYDYQAIRYLHILGARTE